MAHDLPSGDLLSDFTAFFSKATFLRDGSCIVYLMLPPESKPAVLDLSTNDGMALNVSVWATGIPEPDEDLARALGLVD